ncbi:unnamed protein product, partial [Choristocarpus tenellus]
MDGTDFAENPLLECERCHVSVHQHCYGVSVLPVHDGEPWFCQPC